MKQRRLAHNDVSAIGLGCMGLSYGYGPPPPRDEALGLLNEALDLGYTHFDTATMYGGGRNEELLGEAIGHRRDEFFLASKCGLYPGKDRPRDIDGHPDRIRQACDDSLRRLRTDVIDLYYLHRLDRRVPIEDSVGALAELVAAGKVRAIGLSEMSAATIRRGHKIHPIAAIQSEYSLWTRNPEIAVLETCAELGITFVAFSPLGRGFLTGRMDEATLADLAERDLRRRMPRFQPDAVKQNAELVAAMVDVAGEVGCTLAQLALAWVLARGEHVVAIPGTTRREHLRENARGGDVDLAPALIGRLDALVNEHTVVGHRYTPDQQYDIDTEDFDLAANG